MSGKTFLDTNVLVYYWDDDTPAKQARASAILDARPAPSLVISTQVLQEFYVSVTRKLARPLPEKTALDTVRDLLALEVVQLDGSLVVKSIELAQRWQCSLWDGLIVQAALSAGCTRLLTEDLQDGRRFGGLEVENPFRGL